jgi:hypothetical protein
MRRCGPPPPAAATRRPGAHRRGRGNAGPWYGAVDYVGADTVLGYGDVIIIAGKIGDVERFAELP